MGDGDGKRERGEEKAEGATWREMGWWWRARAASWNEAVFVA